MIRIGIYGGTFDPIHKGHLHLIEQLFIRDLIDELIVIPAGQPWLRTSAPIASGADRLAMVKLALQELPSQMQSSITVSQIELMRSGATYTIDTIEEFSAQRPDAHLILVVGSDAFATIERWHRSDELLSQVEVLVIARNGEGLDIDALPISATQLRDSLTAHADEIPQSVEMYIKEKNLYASK